MNKVLLNSIFKPMKIEKNNIKELTVYKLENGKISAYDCDNYLEVNIPNEKGKSVLEANFEVSNRVDFLNIPTMNPISDIKSANRFKISIKDLEFINGFSSNEEVRYYLQGVFVDVKNKKLVSTNGSYLGILDIELNNDIENKAIIPSSAIKLAVNTAKKLKLKDVEIIADYNKTEFIFDGAKLISKNIIGKFPDYEKVIPKNNNKEFSLSKEKIKELVEKHKIDKIGKSNYQAKTLPNQIQDDIDIGINVLKKLDKAQKRTRGNLKCLKSEEKCSPFIVEQDDFKMIAMPLRR